MSYMGAQTLLKTRLLTLSSYFGSSDVAEGDLRILDNGNTNHIVLFPGGVPVFDTAIMQRSVAWEGVLDLFTKFVDDTSYNTFGTLRDAVIANLDASPCLDATYWVISITSDGDPEEVYDKQGGGPFFVWQQLRLTITEQV